MSLNISRTTEPLRFDTGIGHTGYAEILDGPVAAEQTGVLLPGATTVTESLDALFPVEKDVSADVMRALVAGNPSSLRTQNGFGSAASDALRVREDDSFISFSLARSSRGPHEPTTSPASAARGMR